MSRWIHYNTTNTNGEVTDKLSINLRRYHRLRPVCNENGTGELIGTYATNNKDVDEVLVKYFSCDKLNKDYDKMIKNI